MTNLNVELITPYPHVDTILTRLISDGNRTLSFFLPTRPFVIISPISSLPFLPYLLGIASFCLIEGALHAPINPMSEARDMRCLRIKAPQPLPAIGHASDSIAIQSPLLPCGWLDVGSEYSSHHPRFPLTAPNASIPIQIDGGR
jgi:hypothetical protein